MNVTFVGAMCSGFCHGQVIIGDSGPLRQDSGSETFASSMGRYLGKKRKYNCLQFLGASRLIWADPLTRVTTQTTELGVAATNAADADI